jgi:hypothetical protein
MGVLLDEVYAFVRSGGSQARVGRGMATGAADPEELETEVSYLLV